MNSSASEANVGIISVNNPTKGLWRDTQCLIHALRDELNASVFSTGDLFRLDEHSNSSWERPDLQRPAAEVVTPGTELGPWLRHLDVLIVCETLLERVFDLAHHHGVRVVFVPNLDWACLGDNVSRWVEALRRRPWVEIWAKTPHIRQVLEQQGVEALHVPWSIPDEVVRDRDVNVDGPLQLLVNAGMGGWRCRRAVDSAIRAFALARSQEPEMMMLVKSIQPVAQYVPGDALETKGLQVQEGFLARDEITGLYDRADAVIHVSRWEGFGLPLLEALHRGAPVIATDGWPMNELVVHGHNGLLVPAERVDTVRLAPHWEVDEEALAGAMVRLCRDRDLLWRLTCPEPAELKARQHRFEVAVRRLVLGQLCPRVVLFRDGKASPRRRAEEYWADGLASHGYEVVKLNYESASQTVEAELSRPHEFVLTGKAPVELLRQIRCLSTSPLVIWHQDLVEFSPARRGWFEAITAVADICCVPQSYTGQRGADCRVVTLMPGPMTSGDRGAGRRPRKLPPADNGPDAVFLGDVVSGEPRIELVRVLQDVGLVVHGNAESWKRVANISAREPVWDAAADAVNRSAKVLVSQSRGRGTPLYTSVRLFNAAAVGACVAVEAFEGLDELYPAEAMQAFDSVEQAVVEIKALQNDTDRRRRMRRIVEQHTWRHHTWNDRIRVLLEQVARAAPAQEPKREGPKADDRQKPCQIRINLGCGADVRAGYTNLDIRSIPGTVQADLRDGIPLAAGCAQEVLALDILEHFPKDVLQDRVLPEILRVLAPGGTLRARMPDLALIVKQWRSGEQGDDVTAMRIHGRQDYPDNLHYWSYTERSITGMLRKAGFEGARRTESINWNMEIEARKPPQQLQGAGAREDWVRQWDERAARYGRRAVAHVAWSAEQYREATGQWWRLLSNLLASLRRETDRRLLDFGCGAARFSARLADMGFQVEAVDISEQMLRLARVRCDQGVTLHQIVPGCALPFADGTLDVLWSCTVLQHVPDHAFQQLCQDLRRVLRDDALVVLLENTHEFHQRTSSSGHVVFRKPGEYLREFPGIDEVRQVVVEGERHSLITGRLRLEDR